MNGARFNHRQGRIAGLEIELCGLQAMALAGANPTIARQCHGNRFVQYGRRHHSLIHRFNQGAPGIPIQLHVCFYFGNDKFGARHLVG